VDLFKTSIRVKHPERELFTGFDVEYTASTEDGDVVISIMTNRRTVSINASGIDSSYHYLTRRLVMAGLG